MMSEETIEKISWKEKFQLSRRAFVLWYREYPALFAATALYCLLNAVFPYIDRKSVV